MLRYSYIVMDKLSAFGSDAEIRRAFAFLKECGYEGVELNVTQPLGVDAGELERWVGDLDLVIPSFLTGNAYHDGLCLTSPSDSVRERTVERLVSFVDVASRFNAILVVGLLQGFRSDEPDPQVANARITECLSQVASAAGKQGVDIVLEPVNHLQVGFNNSVAEVRALVETVGSPHLRPMVDTVHMNIEESSLAQPIFDCGSSLRHVHLCESHGGIFGSGRVDFGEVLDALDEIGYDGFASVKVYREGLEKGASTSIEHLRSLRPIRGT